VKAVEFNSNAYCTSTAVEYRVYVYLRDKTRPSAPSAQIAYILVLSRHRLVEMWIGRN
jgi:hypothetical protein